MKFKDLLLHRTYKAFTLSELLISLAILGLIATFTVPKILQGTQQAANNAMAKEAAASVLQAYDAYLVKSGKYTDNQLYTTGLTSYFNLAQIDTTSDIPAVTSLSAGNESCSDTAHWQCLKFQNNSLLFYNVKQKFCGFDNSALLFGFQPAPSQEALGLFLYPTRKIAFPSEVSHWTGVCGDSWFYNIFPTANPSWIKW